MMRLRLLTLLLFGFSAYGQSADEKVLTYSEFIGYVKKFHPLVKTANLQVSAAQANLMMARGAFDPKLEVDFDKKQFKDKEYYSVLNSSFKIPTWYGIEVKAGFDNNDGVYLNPQNTVPNQGLTSSAILRRRGGDGHDRHRGGHDHRAHRGRADGEQRQVGDGDGGARQQR